RARRRRARRQHLHRLPLPLPRRAARGRGPRARGRAPRALLLRERVLCGVLHRQRAGGGGGGGRRGRRGAARGTHLHRRAGLRAARARWRGGRRAARGLRRRVRLHRCQEPAARVRAPGSAGGVSLGLAAPAPEGVDPARLAAAYARCACIARGHYENFTIGSWLLPRRLRHDLAAVYAFARGADDLADEGADAGRLERLAVWEERLLACAHDPARADDPVFLALGRVYIPQEDLDRFPESRAALAAGATNDDFRRLLAFEVARTRDLFARGLPLAELVTGRLAREVRLFARGGLAILGRIAAAD